MTFLADLAFICFSIFYLPFFFIKGKHRGGFGWRQRLGLLPDTAQLKKQPKVRVFWIHAVSLGEAKLAQTLRLALETRYPQSEFVFTTVTATGRQCLSQLKKPEDKLYFFPFDLSFCVKRFVRHVGPDAVLILETELWPNFLSELKRRGIPVFVINARLSDRSIPFYRAARRLLGPALGAITAIGAQSVLMKKRFEDIGADPGKVRVTGNLKFDFTGPRSETEGATRAAENFFSREGSGCFWCVAGSTHEGEEELLFKLFPSLRRAIPGFRLLVAPRHLDRLSSIENQARACGVATKRVSLEGTSGYDNSGPDGAAVLLLDRMGVLTQVYRWADAVFVGGSLVSKGGHNLAEPALWGKPILFGPRMENFKDMAQDFIASGAGLEVAGAEDLKNQLVRLSTDAQRRSRLGRAAKELVKRQAGAAARSVDELVVPVLGGAVC